MKNICASLELMSYKNDDDPRLLHVSEREPNTERLRGIFQILIRCD